MLAMADMGLPDHIALWVSSVCVDPHVPIACKVLSTHHTSVLGDHVLGNVGDDMVIDSGAVGSYVSATDVVTDGAEVGTVLLADMIFAPVTLHVSTNVIL